MYVQFTNPAGYPPLISGAHLFEAQGWSVGFIGTDSFGTRGLTLPAQFPFEQISVGSGAGRLRTLFGYLRFAVLVLTATLRHRPRWLYVSDPTGAPAGWLAASLTRTAIVYHEHDSPPVGASRPRLTHRAVKRARAALLRTATAVVFPNAERAALAQKEAGIRREVLIAWNCPSRREVPSEIDPEPAGEELRLVYHGSLNEWRLPNALLDALRRLPKSVTLTVIGYETTGHPGYVNDMLARARELGIQERVHFMGLLDRHRLLRVLPRHDVGLSLLVPFAGNVNFELSIGTSNKTFEYLAAGLPLLVSRDEMWRRQVVDPGYGRMCDPEDSSEIYDQLIWYLKHPIERVQMGLAGRRRILRDWNYETQFAPVIESMQGTTGADR